MTSGYNARGERMYENLIKRENVKKMEKCKKITMENKKSIRGDIPLITIDVEYAVRVSALQEKMERYYARKKAAAERRKKNRKTNIKKQI